MVLLSLEEVDSPDSSPLGKLPVVSLPDDVELSDPAPLGKLPVMLPPQMELGS